MSELLAGALPQAACKLEQEWDEEQVYEFGDLCPSEDEKMVDSGNKLTRKPEKLPVSMESMHPDIEFSAIETKEDIESAIQKLVFEGVIGSKETEEEIRTLTMKAFSLPEVQEWYSGEWKLFNECAIIYKDKGVLQTRRPDRVMMKDGQVVVVDFKFGKENKKYNKQVKGYMQLLSRMGYKNITGYLWYVEEEIIEKV